MLRSMTRMALLCFFTLGAQVAAGEPQIASLDPTFGDQGDGRQVVAFPNGDAGATAIVTDGQGRLLLAGYTQDAQNRTRAVVVRLNADGTPDPAFKRKLAPLPAGTEGNYWSAAVASPDGSAVAVGTFIDQRPDGFCPNESQCWFVCKIDSHGNFSATFGSPQTPGCTAIRPNGAPPLQGFAFAAAIQADGKILIAGGDRSLPEYSTARVVRLTQQGEPDLSFSDDGFAILPAQFFGRSTFYAVDVAADGSIAAGGYYGPNGNQHMIAARFNADGDPLESFSGGARAVAFDQFPPGERYSAAFDIHVEENGSVLISGITDTGQNGQSYRPALAKLDATGNGVEAFGMQGLPMGQRIVETCGVPPCHFPQVRTQVQADGQILLSGTASYSDLEIDITYAMRLSPLGAIDPSFGSNDGVFAQGVATAWWAEASGFSSSTLQEKKLVLAGVVDGAESDAFVAIRFNDSAVFSDSFESD